MDRLDVYGAAWWLCARYFKKGYVPTPFAGDTLTLDLENDVPTPTSRQEELKSFIQGAPPEVQILALFLFILNKKNN